MKKFIKWSGIVIAIPITLFIIVSILIYIPPIQNFIVRKATDMASDATGMNINIERISLSFPLDLVVHNTSVVNEQDTVLNVEKLTVKIQMKPLFKKQVEVDALELNNADVNTLDIIEGMKLKGKLGKFTLASHGVALSPETATINDIDIKDADIDICMTDTTATDTTASEPLYWKILLEKANMENVSLRLDMPIDSMDTKLYFGKAVIKNAMADLHKEEYSLSKLNIINSKAEYNTGNSEPMKGFDPSHINITDINIRLDSVYYQGNRIEANINKFLMKERSGLEVVSTKGKLLTSDEKISIPGIEIKTLDSYISLNATANFNISEINNDGSISARLIADIGKNDLLKLMPDLPEQFKKDYPSVPLQLRAGIDGSLNSLNLTNLSMGIPEHIKFVSDGYVNNAMDSTNIEARFKMNVEFPDTRFLRSILGTTIIPSDFTISGNAGMVKDSINSELTLSQGTGKIDLKARMLSRAETYYAKLNINEFNLHNFMPADSLFDLTAKIEAEGKGFDFFSPETKLEANASISHFQYAKNFYSGIRLNANMDKQNAKAELKVNDNVMDIDAIINANILPEKIKASLETNIKRFDLYAMGISDSKLKISGKIDADASTDMNNNHVVRTSVNNIRFVTPQKTIPAKALNMGVFMAPDSLMGYINSGDMTMLLKTGNSLDKVLDSFTRISELAAKQWEKRSINLDSIKSLMPDMELRLSAKDDNPFANILETKNIRFNKLLTKFTTSSKDGFNGYAYLHKFSTDSLLLDTIYFDSRQAPSMIALKGGVIANKTKVQDGFDISLNGKIQSSDIEFLVKYENDKKETGALIGLKSILQKNGISMHVIPENPILVYRNFFLNKDNYMYLSDKGRIHANISLYDKNLTGLKIYSTPDSTVAQDITVAINNLNIGEFRRIIPYMPDVDGDINAEAHLVINKDETPMAAIETGLKKLAYNKQPLGDWNMSAVYLPKENGAHHLDGYINRNNETVIEMSGSYLSADNVNVSDKLDANMALIHFPLEIANAFTPKELARVKGFAEGNMQINGSSASPVINGSLNMDDVNVFIPMASMNLRFENKPITVTNNKLVFDKYRIFSKGKNPYVIDGNIDFSNMGNMYMNLRMGARNFELFNGKKSKESLVYGKMYIDLDTSIKGNTNNISVRGNANILGTSDFTYVLKDSPLTVEDRLSETVTFVNFSDTTSTKKKAISPISVFGIDMLMNLHIDQAVQCKVDINEDGSNYMHVEGGGDLAFQYTPDGNMLLNGRYSLTNGKMKYELPIISAKTFNIKEGSFIEWTGNVMNPNLNINAYERVRASVAQENQNQRMVTFDVGVSITNRLENLGFAFTLEAPEDGSMQNELAAMSPSEKNKTAITMLATGMYMSENSKGKMDANSTLNSFLQGQVNKIAGNLAKNALDINLGMETTNATETGDTRTDYNFQFAKRFWNNRFRVVIGGKISTGSAAVKNESFIDNISIEYRLDNSGTRYIQLFHDKKYANILEGEVTETGAGIILRKKVSRLGELFIFRRKKVKTEDTEKNESNKDEVK